jgi:hypothetical protein
MTKQITSSQLEAITWIIESTTADDLNKDEHEEFVGVDHNDEPIIEVRYDYWLVGETILRAEEYPEITYTIDWIASSVNKAESLEEAYDFTVEFNERGENILDLGQYVAVDDDDDAELAEHLLPIQIHEVGPPVTPVSERVVLVAASANLRWVAFNGGSRST